MSFSCDSKYISLSRLLYPLFLIIVSSVKELKIKTRITLTLSNFIRCLQRGPISLRDTVNSIVFVLIYIEIGIKERNKKANTETKPTKNLSDDNQIFNSLTNCNTSTQRATEVWTIWNGYGATSYSGCLMSRWQMGDRLMQVTCGDTVDLKCRWSNRWMV